MKSINKDEIKKIPGSKLEPTSTFNFRCHAAIKCFNQCCRNLNLFLYPYDVVRLKNHLGLDSDTFITKYVDVVLRPEANFPDVLLRMADNSEQTCPYLTDQGCSVYPDRPDTCRTFPVEQGLLFDDQSQKGQAVHFFRPPDFCLGPEEDTVWTLETWAQDQEAATYNKMTTRWAELRRLFLSNPWGKEGPEGARAKMAFMATYNIDRFRDFVFNSSFLKRYKVKPDLKKKLKRDDAALLRFGFDWVKLYLWGIKNKAIRLK